MRRDDDRRESARRTGTRRIPLRDRWSQQRGLDRGAIATAERSRRCASTASTARAASRCTSGPSQACMHAQALPCSTGNRRHGRGMRVHARHLPRKRMRNRPRRDPLQCACDGDMPLRVPPTERPQRTPQRHRGGHHVRHEPAQRQRADEHARGPRARDASQIEREAGTKHVHGRECYAAAVAGAKRLAPRRATHEPRRTPDARSR